MWIKPVIKFRPGNMDYRGIVAVAAGIVVGLGLCAVLIPLAIDVTGARHHQSIANRRDENLDFWTTAAQ